MAAGRLPRYFRERKVFLNIYDDSELLKWYRLNTNRNKILYITDFLHKDLCPLTGMSQSIDAIDTTILCPLSVIIQSQEKFQQHYTLYIVVCKSSGVSHV